MMSTVLGVLGVLLNVAFAWPQVWRARVSVVGISTGTVIAGYLARLLWTIYAVQLGDIALLVGQAPVAVGFLAIAVFLARGTPANRLRLLLGLLAATAIAALLAPFHLVLSVVAVVVAAVVNLPQMVRVIRDPQRAAGVSPLMYWLVSAASATWLTYGFAVHDLTISAPHILLLPTGLVTAIAVLRGRRRATPQHDAERPAVACADPHPN